MADHGPIDIFQDDTFFVCVAGRLKLRDFASRPPRGELIFYRRADAEGPKTAFYERTETHAPDDLRRTLVLALGEAGRVVKRRRLYLVGRTRVHIDAVEGLGDFVELEVVLDDTSSIADGEAEVRRLMTALEIEARTLCEGAYVDLIADRTGVRRL